MRVGTVCYATDQGIGIMAKQFYDAGVVTDVIVVAHGKRPTHFEWYPKSWVATDLHDPRQKEIIEEWTRHMDVMLYFETPFHWGAVKNARRSVMIPMYECSLVNPPAEFDLYLCPSELDLRYFPQHKSRLVQIPVYPETWKLRTRAEVFVHNAGHGGLRGRNGTRELLEAMQYVKSPIRLTVRSQSMHLWSVAVKRGDHVKVDLVCGSIPHDILYTDGDVFVFPEKFQGQSYPLEEARAAGMFVMSTDRFPMNTWLPTAVETTTEENTTFRTRSNPLIQPRGYSRARIGPAYNEFDEAILDPHAIAAKIDEWYGGDISAYSLSGKEWAEANSWEVWKPKYLEYLRG